MSTKYVWLEDGVPKGIYTDNMATDPSLRKMAVYVRPTLHRRIKAMAALRGQSMSNMIVDLIVDALNRWERMAHDDGLSDDLQLVDQVQEAEEL